MGCQEPERHVADGILRLKPGHGPKESPMKKLLAPLALAALCYLAPAGECSPTDPHGPCFLTAAAKKPFNWEGSCQISCADGQCRLACSSGVVYASNDFEARLEAEARLRQQAGSQGIVVEGSIRLTVRAPF